MGIRQIGNYTRRKGYAQEISRSNRNAILATVLKKKLLRNYRFFIYRRRGGRSYLRRMLWYMKRRLLSKIPLFF